MSKKKYQTLNKIILLPYKIKIWYLYQKWRCSSFCFDCNCLINNKCCKISWKDYLQRYGININENKGDQII